MNCGVCGAPSPEGSVYCFSCGARLAADPASGASFSGGKPGTTGQIPRRLHAMRAGDILDETLRLYRRNFRLFVGIVAVLQVPLVILQLIQRAIVGPTFNGLAGMSTLGRPQIGMLIFWLGSTIVLGIVSLIFYVFIQAALAQAISQRYLGSPTGVGESYRRALACFWRLLGSTLVAGIVVFMVLAVSIGVPAVILALAIPALGGRVELQVAAAILLAMTMIAGAALASFVGLRWSFMWEAVVLEDVGVMRSLSRSWGLVKGSWWRVLGIFLLGGLFQGIVAGIPAGIIGLMVALAINFVSPGAQLAIAILGGLVGSVFGILAAPLMPTVSLLLYYDLRIRKEGFDLQMLANRAGGGQAPAVGG